MDELGDSPVTIDLTLFKQICYPKTGVAAIIVDLVNYLTGGAKDSEMCKVVEKALKILYQRVAPIVLTEPDSALYPDVT
jgi:hypothetical protein